MSKLVAVTIGIGDEFRGYAEKAAEKVRDLCGIEVRIIGDEHLHLAHQINRGGVNDLKHRVWTLKYRIFDIWPDLDAAFSAYALNSSPIPIVTATNLLIRYDVYIVHYLEICPRMMVFPIIYCPYVPPYHLPAYA